MEADNSTGYILPLSQTIRRKNITPGRIIYIISTYVLHAVHISRKIINQTIDPDAASPANPVRVRA